MSYNDLESGNPMSKLTKHLDLSSPEAVDILKALASEPRLAILRKLSQSDCNVSEIGNALNMSQPTVTRHIQALEAVGVVSSDYSSGQQGMQKKSSLLMSTLEFDFIEKVESERPLETISMPIGLYTLAYPGGTCGLASRTKFIGFLDKPLSFYDPERASAQILWMSSGFVEYTFSNDLPPTAETDRIELIMEICSEAPNYNADWPSDITVWINGVETATWTSPGDFGGTRGALNPSWWVDHMTQHGLLKIWSVDASGAYVDGKLVANVPIDSLYLAPQQPITVRIGVKPDAVNQGGFNLFGSGFGNYPKDLVLRLHHSPKTRSRRAVAGVKVTEKEASSPM